MKRRLFPTGVVICGLAVVSVVVIGGFEDFHHSLRYGALLFLTGAVVITIDRWNAIIPYNIGRPRRETLRKGAICSLYLVPVALVAWSLDWVQLGVWALIACTLTGGLHLAVTMHRHGKIRDVYIGQAEKRVARITRRGAAPPPPPPPGALPPGTS